MIDIKGHPLKVVLAGRFGIGISIPRNSFQVQAVTMLYRRFRAESLCNNDEDNASLHSLQLLPTYVKGMLTITVVMMIDIPQNKDSQQ